MNELAVFIIIVVAYLLVIGYLGFMGYRGTKTTGDFILLFQDLFVKPA